MKYYIDIYFLLSILEKGALPNIFMENIRILFLRIESSTEQQLFEIEILSNIIKTIYLKNLSDPKPLKSSVVFKEM